MTIVKEGEILLLGNEGLQDFGRSRISKTSYDRSSFSAFAQAPAPGNLFTHARMIGGWLSFPVSLVLNVDLNMCIPLNDIII